MLRFALVIVLAPLACGFYAYVGYPLTLWILTKMRPSRTSLTAGIEWPNVTITVPVYNAESTLAATLDRLLEIDYPADRLQLLVISDGSTDRTEKIASDYASRGVELLRLPQRRGKTVAENLALSAARGELIVNVDATILVPRSSLKALVRVFDDPSIGVASGRDVSVGDVTNEHTGVESGYVGYEMWVRDLETRLGSIVGASGCFYAIRREIHADPLPTDLSWDFASALVARQKGLRSVSVPDAMCLVPRAARIGIELKRKARTMARGIRTLFYHRELMNPFVYGGFALMLISHKLLRWLPYLLAPISILALVVLLAAQLGAEAALITLVLFVALGVGVRMQAPLNTTGSTAAVGFIAASVAAGCLAWWAVIRRSPTAIWDPTPRPKAVV